MKKPLHRYRAAPDKAGEAVFKSEAKLRSPYNALSEILGKPHGGEREGGIQIWWSFADSTDRASVLFIHDQKGAGKPSELRALPHYDWVVDGRDKAALDAFCRWLSAEIIEHVTTHPPPRRMTPESKAKINEMIAGGMSAGDAMKAAAEFEGATLALGDLVWPIKKGH